MTDETRSNAPKANGASKLFTLREAADRLGLSTPVLRFYLHKYATSLGIPRIGSGEPLLSPDHLTRLTDLCGSGLHRSFSAPSEPAPSGTEQPAKTAATVFEDPPEKAAPPGPYPHNPELDEPPGGSQRDASRHEENGTGGNRAEAAPPPGAEEVPVRLLDMTHEWLEEMDQKLDHRLSELSQTVDFLAEENRELQVLLSRILTAVGDLSERLARLQRDDPDDRAAAPVTGRAGEKTIGEPDLEHRSVEIARASGEQRSARAPTASRPEATGPEEEALTAREPDGSSAAPAAGSEYDDPEYDASERPASEKTYVEVPRIRRKESSVSAVRREDEAKDWSPVDL